MRIVVFSWFLVLSGFAFAETVDSTTKIVVPGPSDYVIINSISISGNNLTKNRILYRELPFKANDTIRLADLDGILLRSKNNLLNLSLFNFVRIDTIPYFEHRINVHIDVKERWYIFPVPIFEIAERNFNTWLDNPNLARANYGFYLNHENFLGLKQTLSIKVRMGYNEQYGITYTIPNLGGKQSSAMGVGFNYARTHEVPYSTMNDNLYYYKSENYLRNEWNSFVSYSHRTGLYYRQNAELRFIQSNIADTLLAFTKDYFMPNSTSIKLFIASTGFRVDYRDSKNFPLKGFYLGVDLVKQGLGILKDENVNLFYTAASLRKYWQLSERWYYAASIKGKVTFGGKPPYYLQRALGYGDYVRGYELYVVDGQSYSLFKSELRFQLVKPNVLKLDLLPTEKFNTIPYAVYMGLYFDAAYVTDNYYYSLNNNLLPNSWLYGYGVGLNLVTYYDTVIRLEGGLNAKNEAGFYIHLDAPF